jgi:hypothetical protein
LHFLTAIGGSIRGRGQGRSWRQQGTHSVSIKATRLVGQVKISGSLKVLFFRPGTHTVIALPPVLKLDKKLGSLGWNPNFDFQRTALTVAG